MRFRPLHFLAVACLLGLATSCQKKEKEYKALISTDYGDITVLLYNSTPKHRDNFIKLVKDGYYNGTLFHRVIPNFMIQGGDPQSKTAAPGVLLGAGGPGYEIDAEIGAPHIRGALAAARTDNPGKKSSGSQFYIVTGQQVTADMLNQMEQMKHIKYNDAQRELYLKEGGYPTLDMEYTVFGEVLSGLDVVDKISQVARDENNRPATDVKMSIKLIEQ
ncbi:MAG TPA: peptidylprolyl isomerase [Saprospiraceae bacterium]|nr:peptidylprolyl isomerase [Saprospiraceae bacterium]